MIRRVKGGLSAEAKAENSPQVRDTVEAILGTSPRAAAPRCAITRKNSTNGRRRLSG